MITIQTKVLLYHLGAPPNQQTSLTIPSPSCHHNSALHAADIDLGPSHGLDWAVA